MYDNFPLSSLFTKLDTIYSKNRISSNDGVINFIGFSISDGKHKHFKLLIGFFQFKSWGYIIARSTTVSSIIPNPSHWRTSINSLQSKFITYVKEKI